MCLVFIGCIEIRSKKNRIAVVWWQLNATTLVFFLFRFNWNIERNSENQIRFFQFPIVCDSVWFAVYLMCTNDHHFNRKCKLCVYFQLSVLIFRYWNHLAFHFISILNSHPHLIQSILCFVFVCCNCLLCALNRCCIVPTSIGILRSIRWL